MEFYKNNIVYKKENPASCKVGLMTNLPLAEKGGFATNEKLFAYFFKKVRDAASANGKLKTDIRSLHGMRKRTDGNKVNACFCNLK